MLRQALSRPQALTLPSSALRPVVAAAARGLRATPAAHSVDTVQTGAGAPVKTNSTPEAIAAMKYFDGESLVAHQERTRISDPANRTFNYTMLGGARLVGASAARLCVVKFLAAMNPAADVLALASVEVDTSGLKEGDCMTIKWRGKPVFVRGRTATEIEESENVSMSELRDPQADSERCVKPETLVVLGVCTHLGCVPINGAGDYNGWFCPCHGSHYDTSGRIRKGPAPLNLEVPPHDFEGDKLVIG
jgi:ubiquinol-cytochrome c reductase iron-sulfur subunit